MTWRNANLESLLHGSNDNQEGQEVHEHQESDDPEDGKHDKSPSGANMQQESNEQYNCLVEVGQPYCICLQSSRKRDR